MVNESTTVTINDVMTERVMTLTRGQTVGHVRKLMVEHNVHSFPVTDSDGTPVGIVTSTDLLADISDETRVSQVMSKEMKTIPQYSAVDLAARMLRNHRIHHLLVTDHKKIVGIVSSFDLLQLIEGKRFVAKNGPSRSKKKQGARRKAEEAD